MRRQISDRHELAGDEAPDRRLWALALRRQQAAPYIQNIQIRALAADGALFIAAEADTALPQVRQYVSAGGGARADLGERIPLTTSLASQYA
jgi:hypothetical protein